MKYFFILAFTLYSFTSLAALWTTNKDHSELMFQVPYMGVSELTGRFNEFKGEANFEDQKPLIKDLRVSIESTSIDTGNKMRDGHLRGSDFFQSKEHPQITFKSQKIILEKLNQYKAIGDLSIKGISQPHTISFTTTASVKDTWGYENIFVKFKSVINRKDFKINWNKTLDGKEFLVGDEITFWGTFQMQPYRAATPNSKHMIPDTQQIRERDSSLSKKFRDLINWK